MATTATVTVTVTAAAPSADTAAQRQAPQGRISSAVPEMSVAEIRRALSKLRDIAARTTPESPLFVCDKLHNNKSIAEFAKEFVFGHHLKRHYKSVAQANLSVRKKPSGAATASPPRVPHAAAETKAVIGIAVPGPKGDVNDPFPFSSTWFPKTQRGKRAFEEKNTKTNRPSKLQKGE